VQYCLINKITTKPDKRDEVIRIMLESGKPFDTNDNCLLYMVSKDTQSENVIWVLDVWNSYEAHEEAMAKSDMRQFVKEAIPLLQHRPEQFIIQPVGGKPGK
jgi:quinol monooxygenase YgiN